MISNALFVSEVKRLQDTIYRLPDARRSQRMQKLPVPQKYNKSVNNHSFFKKCLLLPGVYAKITFADL